MPIQFKLDWKNENDIACPRMKKSREFYYSSELCYRSNFLNTVASRMYYSLHQALHAIVDKYFRDNGHGQIMRIQRKEDLVQAFKKYYPEWRDEIDLIHKNIYNMRVKGDYYLEYVKSLDIEGSIDDFEKLMNEFMRYMKCDIATTQ